MTLQNIRFVSAAAVASAEYLANVTKEERLGSLIRRDDYFRPTFRPGNCSMVGTVDNNRSAFIVRLDDGIGQEFITIDQTADAASAILKVGDQVIVTLVDDVHIEDTIRGTFSFTTVDSSEIDQTTLDNSKILRQAQYVDGKNRLCNVTLALIGEKSTTKMICVEQVIERAA